MDKFRLYIVQLIGIVVLLCGYFLSDQPDRESVMHFATDSSSSYVICMPAARHLHVDGGVITSNSPQDKSGHRFNQPKYVSFETIMPQIVTPISCRYLKTVYHPSFPQQYDYLFFEEINPPPPKAC